LQIKEPKSEKQMVWKL